MTPEQISRLRVFYHSLRGQLRVLGASSEKEYLLIKDPNLIVLQMELNNIQDEFPGLIPNFDKQLYFSHNGSGGVRLYHATGILSVIEMVLARLEAVIDESKGTPVIETKEFGFIAERKLRGILERDYAEIQRAYVSECWKSVIIVSGSAIEAILLDRLQTEVAKARSSSKAPKESDLTRWDLAQLIDVTVDLWPDLAGVEKLSHSVRGYRNLVHPGNEIRTGLTVAREEARIALEVLNLVHRELS
jgi:hypothetical protein